MNLLEYMAMGRAVVAPRLENIRDVVSDGLNGILFTPGDAGDLSNALVAHSMDPVKRASLGQAARRTVDESLNWRRNAERVVALVTPRCGCAALQASRVMLPGLGPSLSAGPDRTLIPS